MIERSYVEELQLDPEGVDGINEINVEEGVRWLYSFLAADKRKTCCLYEATSVEVSQRCALPADTVIEVTDRVHPDPSLVPVTDGTV